MRFTPVLFASVAAASIYGYEPEPEPVKPSSSVKDYDYGYGYKPSTPAQPVVPVKSSSVKKDYDYGYKPSSAPVSKKGWKTTTIYETECYTVTSASSTKVWTSVKAIPTVCEDDEDDSYKPSKSTPAAPVKPTKAADKDLPYCSAYTETCTVTVTATKDKDYSPAKPTGGDKDYDYPAKPSTPAAPVVPVKPSYPAGPEGGAKPSGTGAWSKPYPSQFTGAASAQKAGALLAGAGAVAAMLL